MVMRFSSYCLPVPQLNTPYAKSTSQCQSFMSSLNTSMKNNCCDGLAPNTSQSSWKAVLLLWPMVTLVVASRRLCLPLVMVWKSVKLNQVVMMVVHSLIPLLTRLNLPETLEELLDQQRHIPFASKLFSALRVWREEICHEILDSRGNRCQTT